MKIKDATLIGLVGALISLFLSLFYMMNLAGLFSYNEVLAWITSLLNFVSTCTLALFFFMLYKNQK